MAKKIGKDCSVRIGANVVVGIGTYNMDGVATEMIDASAFRDEWKQKEYGMKDGGTVSFSGHYDPADTTGQRVLEEANLYNSALTNVRFYIDSTSFYAPCQTTGYFSPTLTTGAPTVASTVRVTSIKKTADKGGLMSIDFTLDVSGVLVLV